MSEENSAEGQYHPSEPDKGKSREATKGVRGRVRAIAQATRARMRGIFGHSDSPDSPIVVEPDAATIPNGSHAESNPINTAETPLEQPIRLTNRLRQVFGEDRIRHTNENAATPQDSIGLVNALDIVAEAQREADLIAGIPSPGPEALIGYTRENQPTHDDPYGLENGVQLRYYPYENERAYDDAKKDGRGRPYLGQVSNIILETDDEGHVRAREHLYIDRDYNSYISRTVVTDRGEITEIIPASYEDTVRALDTINGRLIPINNEREDRPRGDSAEHREKQALAARYIAQYKEGLDANPAFVAAVVNKYADVAPFEEPTPDDQAKALAEFWHGSGEAVTCFVGDRFVEVSYLKDIAEATTGDSIPDTPDSYETIYVSVHPGDNARVMQSIQLTTNPMESVRQIWAGNVYYGERQMGGRLYTASSSDQEEQEQAVLGAESVLRVLSGTQEEPASVFGLDIDGEASDEEKKFFISEYEKQVDVPSGVRKEKDIHKKKANYDSIRIALGLSSLAKRIDRRLDEPFEPSTNRSTSREKNKARRPILKFRRGR